MNFCGLSGGRNAENLMGFISRLNASHVGRFLLSYSNSARRPSVVKERGLQALVLPAHLHFARIGGRFDFLSFKLEQGQAPVSDLMLEQGQDQERNHLDPMTVRKAFNTVFDGRSWPHGHMALFARQELGIEPQHFYKWRTGTSTSGHNTIMVTHAVYNWLQRQAALLLRLE